jgi:hypothetical protein
MLRKKRALIGACPYYSYYRRNSNLYLSSAASHYGHAMQGKVMWELVTGAIAAIGLHGPAVQRAPSIMAGSLAYLPGGHLVAVKLSAFLRKWSIVTYFRR